MAEPVIAVHAPGYVHEPLASQQSKHYGTIRQVPSIGEQSNTEMQVS